MKVHYDRHRVAYLENEALPDGSHVGSNKHTDLPVHLLWDDGRDEWVEVCIREFVMPDVYRGEWVEVGERPPCSCWEAAPSSTKYYA